MLSRRLEWRESMGMLESQANHRLTIIQPLLTVSHLRECRITSKEAEEKIEKKMKYEEEEKDYVLIDMNDVEYQK